MITLDVWKNSKGLIDSYEVSGHAGYAEEGQDIICSAVSALTQTPIYGLTNHLKLKPEVEINQDQGFLRVVLKEESNELTEAILETMLMGVESIARQCPKYVRIHQHRR
ncbi:MAG: ribosomal-processing cysteine protease Prp [Phascolarctobacterium sp.]|nr:ribosomal-processing cysteine protease Prp [Phascolarctobacterium sp.]